ncbi:IclR family transcriptional regulator [Curtobacterium sp. MCBD17_034]|uniref:IclR family transcriptional regulator n=1 Tax=unclassified Curtobacterium TaxID=257496 RepID=UPI000DA89A10|nr:MULTISPECIES: IclR family transcriptional regulator [unclassified Curtobacterium]PZF60098.1 IclR family transcriptional regulator [Curtobacterium sp. MCBD17_034]PZM34783.1 IclR family transcriptional regulator [Curtobacterium sp. MCBD17_031]
MAEPRSVPAATNAVRLLRYLGAQRGPVTAAAVARELRLPRSSTYHLLAALEAEGFVVHYPEERRYGIGVAAFELGSGYLRQAPLARLGAPVLGSLVDRLGESAHIAVLQGRDVVYVLEERAPHRPVLVSDVGVRLPSHVTASGRAMLAELDAPQIRALFPDRTVFAEGDDPRDPRGLRTVLAATRARGFAWEHEGVSAGLASVALCVRDSTGWPVASIAVTFRTEDYAEERWPELAERVRPFARELQRRVAGPATTG